MESYEELEKLTLGKVQLTSFENRLRLLSTLLPYYIGADLEDIYDKWSKKLGLVAD